MRKFVVVAGVILVLTVNGVLVWRVRVLSDRLSNAEWSAAVQSKSDESAIAPEVGTIQFMKRGYSIHLENVRYGADGLSLKGHIGNPLNLTLTNLTLRFVVTKNLYDYRSEFVKDEFSFFIGPEPIGQAQTSPIDILSPGTRAPFDVTVPNVKQTKDGIRVVVSFTGERYSY